MANYSVNYKHIDLQPNLIKYQHLAEWEFDLLLEKLIIKVVVVFKMSCFPIKTLKTGLTISNRLLDLNEISLSCRASKATHFGRLVIDLMTYDSKDLSDSL